MATNEPQIKQLLPHNGSDDEDDFDGGVTLAWIVDPSQQQNEENESKLVPINFELYANEPVLVDLEWFNELGKDLARRVTSDTAHLIENAVSMFAVTTMKAVQQRNLMVNGFVGPVIRLLNGHLTTVARYMPRMGEDNLAFITATCFNMIQDMLENGNRREVEEPIRDDDDDDDDSDEAHGGHRRAQHRVEYAVFYPRLVQRASLTAIVIPSVRYQNAINQTRMLVSGKASITLDSNALKVDMEKVLAAYENCATMQECHQGAEYFQKVWTALADVNGHLILTFLKTYKEERVRLAMDYVFRQMNAKDKERNIDVIHDLIWMLHLAAGVDNARTQNVNHQCALKGAGVSKLHTLPADAMAVIMCVHLFTIYGPEFLVGRTCPAILTKHVYMDRLSHRDMIQLTYARQLAVLHQREWSNIVAMHTKDETINPRLHNSVRIMQSCERATIGVIDNVAVAIILLVETGLLYVYNFSDRVVELLREYEVDQLLVTMYPPPADWNDRDIRVFSQKLYKASMDAEHLQTALQDVVFIVSNRDSMKEGTPSDKHMLLFLNAYLYRAHLTMGSPMLTRERAFAPPTVDYQWSVFCDLQPGKTVNWKYSNSVSAACLSMHNLKSALTRYIGDNSSVDDEEEEEEEKDEASGTQEEKQHEKDERHRLRQFLWYTCTHENATLRNLLSLDALEETTTNGLPEDYFNIAQSREDGQDEEESSTVEDFSNDSQTYMFMDNIPSESAASHVLLETDDDSVKIDLTAKPEYLKLAHVDTDDYTDNEVPGVAQHMVDGSKEHHQ